MLVILFVVFYLLCVVCCMLYAQDVLLFVVCLCVFFPCFIFLCFCFSGKVFWSVLVLLVVEHVMWSYLVCVNLS